MTVGDMWIVGPIMSLNMTKLLLTGIAALFLATGTAHAIEVKGLPEEFTWGTWRTCEEFPENNDDDSPREIFAPDNGRGCERAGFALYLSATGYSGPGRGGCNFEKIDKIGNAYQVYANCNIGNPYSARTENLELEIINGYLVVTYLSEG
jgi:hypothetical protein